MLSNNSRFRFAPVGLILIALLAVPFTDSTAFAQTVTATISLSEGFPAAMALNPVTNNLYVADSSAVTKVNGATDGTTTFGTVYYQSLDGIAVNPVTNKIYVTDNTYGFYAGWALVVDGKTDAVTTINGPFYGSVCAVALNPYTNKVYLASSLTEDHGNYGPGDVMVLDGTTNSYTIVTDPHGTSPIAVAVNPITDKIYVANQRMEGDSTGSISVIDGATGTVTHLQDPNADGPNAVAVNPATNLIYVANVLSSNVTVIDGATNAIATVTDLNAAGSGAIAVNPVTNQIYVANSKFQQRNGNRRRHE